MKEATVPSQFEEDACVLRTNLFFHPFSLVMSLVFPVREMKDKLLSKWKKQDFTNVQTVHLKAPDGKIVFASHTLQYDFLCEKGEAFLLLNSRTKMKGIYAFHLLGDL